MSSSALVAIAVFVCPGSSAVRCSRRLFDVWYLILVQSWAISVITTAPAVPERSSGTFPWPLRD
jgi:hypothetical protein